MQQGQSGGWGKMGGGRWAGVMEVVGRLVGVSVAQIVVVVIVKGRTKRSDTKWSERDGASAGFLKE